MPKNTVKTPSGAPSSNRGQISHAYIKSYFGGIGCHNQISMKIVDNRVVSWDDTRVKMLNNISFYADNAPEFRSSNGRTGSIKLLHSSGALYLCEVSP